MDTTEIKEVLAYYDEKIMKEDFSPEQVKERISNFTDEFDKMDMSHAIAFSREESNRYSRHLLHDVLIELFKRGYLNKPE